MIAFLLLAAAAAEPVCIRQEILPGFEQWGHAGGTDLRTGAAATLALTPADKARFDPALARPTQAGTYGGTFPFAIDKGGRYGIALSEGAWLDVIADGQRLTAAAHAHGAACSGIRKIVRFALKPGRYRLQLSEAKASSISAMISAPE